MGQRIRSGHPVITSGLDFWIDNVNGSDLGDGAFDKVCIAEAKE